MMRSKLRVGDAVTLYLASPRLKALLDQWLKAEKEELPLAA
jgi:hypothetical protein